MSVRRAVTALLLAGAVCAPAAHANYPYTCDDVDCFAEWCAENAADCADGSPRWFHCDDNGCYGGSGDITRYVAYCTLIAGPRACLP